jgi:hypothetical protein
MAFFQYRNTSSILKAFVLGDYSPFSHNILSSAGNLAAMLPALNASSVKHREGLHKT